MAVSPQEAFMNLSRQERERCYEVVKADLRSQGRLNERITINMLMQAHESLMKPLLAEEDSALAGALTAVMGADAANKFLQDLTALPDGEEEV